MGKQSLRERRSVLMVIAPELRSLIERVAAVESTAARVELVLQSQSYIDPKEIVCCVVQNIADELGETVATLIVTLGGDPHAAPACALAKVRPRVRRDAHR